MLKHKNNHRVLSIYPTARGCAFVLFDSPLSPLDWGKKETPKDVGNAKCIAVVKDMLERFRPDVLVIEDVVGGHSKRSVRIKRILTGIAPKVEKLSIRIELVKRKDIRAAFAQFGVVNKQDIAKVIAKKMEAFAPRVPRPKKPWQSEDPRMALFDAASRGLTYYYRLEEAE